MTLAVTVAATLRKWVTAAARPNAFHVSPHNAGFVDERTIDVNERAPACDAARGRARSS
jgi:hypothetical protein